MTSRFSILLLLGVLFVSACAGSGQRPPADPNGLVFGRSPATAGQVAR